MTRTEVERLNRLAEECKQRNDYAGYWRYRRAFLLAQAQLYQEQHNVKGNKR